MFYLLSKVEHLIKTLVTKKIPASDGFSGKILQIIGSILHKLAQRKDKNLRGHHKLDHNLTLQLKKFTTRRNIHFLIRKHTQEVRKYREKILKEANKTKSITQNITELRLNLLTLEIETSSPIKKESNIKSPPSQSL